MITNNLAPQAQEQPQVTEAQPQKQPKLSKVGEQIKLLQTQKMQAVELENYDEAKRLKTIIDALTEIQDEIERLDSDKIKAVEEERYDDAKRIKLRVDTLLSQALNPGQSLKEERNPSASRFKRPDSGGYNNQNRARWQFEDRKVPEADNYSGSHNNSQM